MQSEHEEELEVLKSIYEGDQNFVILDNFTFQYKFEDEFQNRTFLIEIRWGEDYPNVVPEITLDLFYNKHLIDETKERLRSSLLEQAEANIGVSMTFTLIEWLKEEKARLLEGQPEEASSSCCETSDAVANGILSLSICHQEKEAKKTDRLTKAQKRRMWDRQTMDGSQARGADWIDIIKHLSQTGNVTT